MISLDALTNPAPPPGPADWNDEGVVLLPGFLPDDLMDAYVALWRTEHGCSVHDTGCPVFAHAGRPEGWPHATPYMEHDALRALLTYGPLCDAIEALIGEPPGLHLNLTGWVSTERDFHQDQYLNEPGVDDAYAAVWVALDTIHPDSGPFQYVPGSHRWRQVDRAKLLAAMDPAEANSPQWPKHSERLLTYQFEREIALRDAPVVSHLPERGDVLIWHSRLLHRGSKPKVPGIERRAVIAHYSGIETRSKIDMPNFARDDGGCYFVLGGTQPVA